MKNNIRIILTEYLNCINICFIFSSLYRLLDSIFFKLYCKCISTLSLFVSKFYDFSENDHALLKKVFDKKRDKQTEKFMDEVSRVCVKE